MSTYSIKVCIQLIFDSSFIIKSLDDDTLGNNIDEVAAASSLSDSFIFSMAPFDIVRSSKHALRDDVDKLHVEFLPHRLQARGLMATFLEPSPSTTLACIVAKLLPLSRALFKPVITASLNLFFNLKFESS